MSITVYVVSAILVFVFSGLRAMAGIGAAFLFVPLCYLGVPLAEATPTALLSAAQKSDRHLVVADRRQDDFRFVQKQGGMTSCPTKKEKKMTTQFIPPEWAFEFHAHECPFMPIGYRMGKLALEYLGVEKEPDHGFFVFPELGEGHPQTCMMDGLQIVTGATYGKVLMAKTFYGKLAATFYHPQKGAVRYSLLPDFVDAMGKFEFFVYRKKGIEPSHIPLQVRREVIQWTYDQPDETIFKVEARPDFKYTPVKGSFNKTKCSVCGEYVFDRYVRMKDGQPVCIPCSGYEKTALVER